MAEMDVKTLIARLQRMHGHVGRRDKETIVAAIGALTDLSVQLFSATHLNYKQVPKKAAFELRRVDDDAAVLAEADAAGAVAVDRDLAEGVSSVHEDRRAPDGATALPLP